MVKFPEATARIIHNVFVCRKCKTKMKTTALKVTQKKSKCRKCGGRALRAIRKK